MRSTEITISRQLAKSPWTGIRTEFSGQRRPKELTPTSVVVSGSVFFAGSSLRIVQSGSPRLITQLASRVVYEVGFAGIYYRSRYGHGFENWACFEPFRIRDTDSQAIAKDHAVL